MYWFKTEEQDEILAGRRKEYIAGIVGITRQMIYNITNGRVGTTKTTAYAITKALNPDANILDYFIRKEK